MGYFADTVSASTLGVHDTLRNTLTSEVRKLVKQVEIAQDDGALGSGRHGVLVVLDGRTVRVCDGVLLHRTERS